MSARQRIVIVLVVLAVAAGGYGLWSLGMSQGMKMAAPAESAPPRTERKVLYWHDPMVPGPKFDKPGKSPFMDMQLVPVYEEGHPDGGVTVSSRLQQNLGVRTADVIEGDVAPKLESVGSVAWNDRDVALVQARANGFLEKLHVRAALDPVHKGEALAELYVPDWVAAQDEFLSIRRMKGPGSEALLDAARQRMRLAGMTEEQIGLVESESSVHARLTIAAPISGVVGEITAREGMTVATGTQLFRINGLSTVWVNAELPEGVASQVRVGQAVEARVAALSGDRFTGHVGAVLPEVNPVTRTLKVRIEIANSSGKLAPGMFATIDFAPAAKRKALLVPAEAVIRTGERSLVVAIEEGADNKPRFHPVEVETGVESNGMVEIRKGLARGQKVVTSGQFLIDSEASLKAAATRLDEAPSGGAKP